MQKNKYNIENSKKEKFKYDFKNALYNMKKQKEIDKITFICVGTTRLIGDSLGPYVGSNLKEIFEQSNYYNINIYGTLEENINYKNIMNKLNEIDNKTGLIVIDAALSNRDDIGKIHVSNKQTILGEGLAKNKIKIGDISIKTAVAQNYKIPFKNLKALQTTPLNKILELSNVLSEGILDIVKMYY